MIDMARRQILPAMLQYTHKLTQAVLDKNTLSAALVCDAELSLVRQLSELSSSFMTKLDALDTSLQAAQHLACLSEQATYYRDTVLPAMAALRADADQAEQLVAVSDWPLPTYTQLLYYL